MGFQKKRPSPLLTGLVLGSLLLHSWVCLAQPTSLSGALLVQKRVGRVCSSGRGGVGCRQTPPACLQTPGLSLQHWPTTPTCARPLRMLMAATTLVSSVLDSLILQRKPTAAICRPRGASAAPRLNLRPYTKSTCPPFCPHPFSGENSSPAATGH
jgi:hypothetical protein